MNKATGEAVAMKMIDIVKHPDARQNVKKETTVHRMLNHPYIIKYFGQRSEVGMEYIFLEYASGGELFDRIGNGYERYFQLFKILNNSTLLVYLWAMFKLTYRNN